MSEEIRVSRRAGYSAIPNHIHSDQRLSIEARGMLCLIMSMSEGWVFRASNLRKQAGREGKPLGRDKYRSIIKQITEAGYLEIKTAHDDGGRFAGTKWVINDAPQQDVDTEGLKTRPTVESTEGLKNRPPEKPDSGEIRPLKNNNLSKNKQKEDIVGSQFQEFWDAFPHRKDSEGKPKKAKRPICETRFRKAVKSGVSAERIISAAKAYRHDDDVKRGYGRMASTWLNDEAWGEIPDPEVEKQQQADREADLHQTRIDAIKSKGWYCKFISADQVRDHISAGDVTPEQAREAGLLTAREFNQCKAMGVL